MVGIYLLKNTINKKVYVGQSINVEERIKSHFEIAKNKRKKNNEIQVVDRAIRKYGEENFQSWIILECEEDKLDMFESYFIFYYDSTNRAKGYNLTTGGQKYKVNDEFRERVSEATREAMKNVPKEVLATQLGKPRSKETRDKISKTLKGTKKPEGFGEASSKRQKGKTMTASHKKNMSIAAQKLCWVTNEIEDLRIHKDELDYYLSLNYRRGRKKFSEEHIKNISDSHKKQKD